MTGFCGTLSGLVTAAVAACCLLRAADPPRTPVPKKVEPAAVTAITAKARTTVLHIPHVPAAPKLTDYLDGRRPEAASVDDFRQRSPGDGTPVSEPTRAYLSYDDRNLYVVFVCKDDPQQIRAHLAKREDIGDDDQVSVLLDTFDDGQHAYVFSVNPLNIQRDGLLLEGQSTDYNFDAIWHSEARMTADGYVALFAIPFKSVRFSGAAVQKWGIALGRAVVRKNESSYWPYITTRKQTFVPQFATLDGVEDISPSRNMSFVPYVTMARARELGSSGYQNQTDIRGGMDSKIVIKNAFTLDTTINPDFSQVESDDPQVTINQRFEVYFPEKRPFFLENSTFFQTPINLFFSRRIADPEFGVRLTGKTGNWAVGALASDDRGPGEGLSSTNSMYGQHAIDGVFRVQRYFTKQSYVGFIGTFNQFGSSFNRAGGIDTHIALTDNWSITAQMARSYDLRLDGTSRTGPAYNFDLTHAGRHFDSISSYVDRSPDFRAPLGFVNRVDVRQGTQYMDYYWRPESGHVLDFGPSLTVTSNWDRTGRVQDRSVDAEFMVDLNGPLGFRVSQYNGYEYYLGNGFDERRSGASFYASWIKWLTLYGGFGAGTGVNYAPGGGLNPFLARSQDVNAGFTLKPTHRTTITQYYFFTRLGQPADAAAQGIPSATVFNNHIARTKMNFQFTRALSVRAIVDYYGVLPNADLASQTKYKQLTGDILLTYMLNPGTAVYFGYNSAYANVADPSRQDYLPPIVRPSTLIGRQLFFKISYFFNP